MGQTLSATRRYMAQQRQSLDNFEEVVDQIITAHRCQCDAGVWADEQGQIYEVRCARYTNTRVGLRWLRWARDQPNGCHCSRRGCRPTCAAGAASSSGPGPIAEVEEEDCFSAEEGGDAEAEARHEGTRSSRCPNSEPDKPDKAEEPEEDEDKEADVEEESEEEWMREARAQLPPGHILAWQPLIDYPLPPGTSTSG